MNSIIWCKKWLIKIVMRGQLARFFLQGNTNKHIDISRKTTDSYRIEKSYPTLMGSIQTQFIPKLFADGNLVD
jgi:hypothetical protein